MVNNLPLKIFHLDLEHFSEEYIINPELLDYGVHFSRSSDVSFSELTRRREE